jgi:hypothetical protein
VIRFIPLLALALVSLGRPVPATSQMIVPLTDAAEASVLTMLPGEGLHALFGHTALRISDPANGVDYVYNYGTFDFGDPLFIPRFVYGQMDYFLSVPSFQRTVYHYQNVEGRPVLEQVLNLTPPEVAEMFMFLERNAWPENRFYRYDFFFDNCSTRPRDVIEHVLGDRLSYGGDDLAAERTFREYLDLFLTHRPFLRDGMFLLLGTPADRVATPREAMFLPTVLFDILEQSTVLRDVPEPLVVRSDTIAWVDGYTEPGPALPWGLMLTSALLALGALASIRDIRSGRAPSVVADAVLFGSVGFVGVVILLMGYASQHTVTAPNLHIAWAWPTHVVAAAMISRRTLQPYLLLTAVVTAAFCLLWFVWPQTLPAAFLPLALLTAVRASARFLIWRRHTRLTPAG